MAIQKSRFLLLPLILALAGCELVSNTSEVERTRAVTADFSNIEDPRARWEAYELADYTIEQVLGCFCAGPRKFVAVVRDNDVVALQKASPALEDESWLDGYHTVDELFDLIEDARERDPAVLEVSYHPRYGYPTRIYVDYSAQTADEELGFTLSNLRRLVD